MSSFFDDMSAYCSEHVMLYTAVVLVGLVIVSWILNATVKRLLLRIALKLLEMTPAASLEGNPLSVAVSRLSLVVPALVFSRGVYYFQVLPEGVVKVVANVAHAFIILTIARSVDAGLNAVHGVYKLKFAESEHAIKGYVQLVKMGLYIIAGILIVSILLDKSPVILLSGIGAMAAVLILVFQDTLLSLVAGIQISANKTVKVGDWLEIPSAKTNGVVTDIALHNVRIRNWNRTITTLPIRRLVTDPVINWRGMQESGGRRIARSICIDQLSIRFLSKDELAELAKLDFVDPLGKDASFGLSFVPKGYGEDASKWLTNVGLFRCYAEHLLRKHPMVDQNDTLFVRHGEPGPNGLPVEFYCFLLTTKWAEYEALQADLFDHLYACLPAFKLMPFQLSGGSDGIRNASWPSGGQA